MRGSTFAELMLATLIVGTTVVASISSLSQSAEVYHYFAEGPHEALMLAQEIHEAAILLPWEADPGTPAAFGTEIVTIWDLDEEEYNPPRSAEYEVITSHSAWTQEIGIRTVDLENPSVEVDPEDFEGQILLELQVTVLNGNQEVGVFPWWITAPGTEDDV